MSPPFECSMPNSGPPGCESVPMTPVSMSNQRAVRALRWAMSILPSQAPSMRTKALRLPPASTTAMSIFVLISAAFCFAAATIRSAASRVKSFAMSCLLEDLVHWLWELPTTFLADFHPHCPDFVSREQVMQRGRAAKENQKAKGKNEKVWLRGFPLEPRPSPFFNFHGPTVSSNDDGSIHVLVESMPL